MGKRQRPNVPREHFEEAKKLSKQYMATEDEDVLQEMCYNLGLAIRGGFQLPKLSCIDEEDRIGITWPLVLHYPMEAIQTPNRLHISVFDKQFPLVCKLLLRFWPSHVRGIQAYLGVENLPPRQPDGKIIIPIDLLAPILGQPGVAYFELFNVGCRLGDCLDANGKAYSFPNIVSFRHYYEQETSYSLQHLVKWFPNSEWLPQNMQPVSSLVDVFPRLKYAYQPRRPLELLHVPNIVYLFLHEPATQLFRTTALQSSLQTLALDNMHMTVVIDILHLLNYCLELTNLDVMFYRPIRVEDPFLHKICVDALYKLDHIRRLHVRDLTATTAQFRKFLDTPPSSLVRLKWTDSDTFQTVSESLQIGLCNYDAHIQVPNRGDAHIQVIIPPFFA